MKEIIPFEVATSQQLGYNLGIKLIRGAYMNEERNLAKENHYESPIWDSLEETHDCYNENLKLVMLENVLRLYNAESSTSTSLYQHWLSAKEAGQSSMNYAGHDLDVSTLETNGRLPYPMDTPSTKEKVDRTIDAAYLIENGICTAGQYAQIRNSSLMAFGMVSQYLAQRGMVLVDTKTEHGINAAGQIVAADELYTMDSSRFWKLDDDGELITRDGKPVSFSKEFARGMVKEQGQQFSEEQANEIAIRYIEGLQHITGETFTPDLRPRDQRLVESTSLILDALL